MIARMAAFAGFSECAIKLKQRLFMHSVIRSAPATMCTFSHSPRPSAGSRAMPRRLLFSPRQQHVNAIQVRLGRSGSSPTPHQNPPHVRRESTRRPCRRTALCDSKATPPGGKLWVFLGNAGEQRMRVQGRCAIGPLYERLGSARPAMLFAHRSDAIRLERRTRCVDLVTRAHHAERPASFEISVCTAIKSRNASLHPTARSMIRHRTVASSIKPFSDRKSCPPTQTNQQPLTN